MAAQAIAAYAIYPPSASLNDVVHALNQGGFENEDICMMVAPRHAIAAKVREANAHSSEREASADAARLIGWLSEFGAVMIPGVGFFIRSAAYFHALIAAKESSALCGNAGTLLGLGFSQTEAKRFENRLRDAGVLVYVSCPGKVRSGWALELLRCSGADEAATLCEAAMATVA
jgi:hypothetical protein